MDPQQVVGVTSSGWERGIFGRRYLIFFLFVLFVVGTEEGVSSPGACYVRSNHLFWVNGRSGDVSCSRTRCCFFGWGLSSARVGLGWRWSHSCLFVECPYVVPSHLARPPLSPPFLSLSLTLLFFPVLWQTSLPSSTFER